MSPIVRGCVAISVTALFSSASASASASAAEVVFIVNPDATVTAIIDLEHAGSPRPSAWVIPVRGKPKPLVSSSVVFQRLDAATAPEYWVELTTEGKCRQPGPPDAAWDAAAAIADPSSADAAAAPPPAALGQGSGLPRRPAAAAAMHVALVDESSVGPYDYVNIKIDPTVRDVTGAATDWLTMKGYNFPQVDGDWLTQYVKDGLHLLAFKLHHDAEVGEIRPVMVTYESKLPMLSLGATTPPAPAVKVWVIGPSQAVPDNQEALVVNDALLDWLSTRRYPTGTLPSGGVGPFDPYHAGKPRNYDAVVSAAAEEAIGQGFVTELGAPASRYRDKVWSAMDDQQFAMVSGKKYADGVDAVLTADAYYRGWDGWKGVVQRATTLPAGVTIDEFCRSPDRYRGAAKVDTTALLALLDKEVVKPVADTAAMLYRAPYLTRLYRPASSGPTKVDPTFTFNADLALVSNIHIARQFVQCRAGLDPNEAPWRMELPQGGVIAGRSGGRWPVAERSMPANLKIVQLSSTGSGTVVKDNRDDIAMKLVQIGGTIGSGMATRRLPHNGVMIGENQKLTPHGPLPAPTYGSPKAADGNRCSVSQVGADTPPAPGLWWPLALLLLAACGRGGAVALQRDGGASGAPRELTRAELMDPESCKDCHPIHYREWSSSMHAYSARDPVFVAMNKRGQRETHGELGDFCMRCHAPMAALDKTTKDGLDLERSPEKERGVSCFFCHNVVAIEGDHNAMLRLANDTTMRGPIRDPLPTRAHQAQYSGMFEDTSPTSTALCGGCHDIVTRSGVHLERTFEEYRAGLFSKSATGAPPAFDSCVGCHMSGQKAYAAVGSVDLRTVHEHLWAGIDLPLTPFPHRDALHSAIEDCQLGIASVSFFTLEVTPPDLFSFQIETKAGHHQPSGAAQDRRMWLEFMAYDEGGRPLEPVSSGDIADSEIEERGEDDPKRDPHLLMLRDRIYDAQGKQVHMFWQAAASPSHPDGYESNVIPVATTSYIDGTHVLLKQYRASGPHGLPARVTARLRIRPIGLDVLKDLVDSGDLDPAIAAEMPTFTFGAQIEWTPQQGVMRTVSASSKTDCRTYRCLLDPSSPSCAKAK